MTSTAQSPDTIAKLHADAVQKNASDWGHWGLNPSVYSSWKNQSSYIDNAIGAVYSGDDAFAGVMKWIEVHGGCDETALILTADHAHYFHLDRPKALIQTSSE